MHWEAQLSGPVGVIDELARNCNAPKCQITTNGVMRSFVMDKTDDPSVAWVLADLVMKQQVTAHLVPTPGGLPVRVISLSRIHDDGRRESFSDPST